MRLPNWHHSRIGSQKCCQKRLGWKNEAAIWGQKMEFFLVEPNIWPFQHLMHWECYTETNSDSYVTLLLIGCRRWDLFRGCSDQKLLRGEGRGGDNQGCWKKLSNSLRGAKNMLLPFLCISEPFKPSTIFSSHSEKKRIQPLNYYYYWITVQGCPIPT